MSFYLVGGAVIPIADRTAANRKMERQGYGPNNFSIELAPGGEETPTQCAAYMPMDKAIYSALDQIVTQYGGEWIMAEEENAGYVQPANFRTAQANWVVRLKILLRLVILKKKKRKKK